MLIVVNIGNNVSEEMLKSASHAEWFLFQRTMS